MPPYKSSDIPVIAITVILGISLIVTVVFLNRDTNLFSKAATINSIEPENGTFTGNVIAISDSNSSGGQFITFGYVTPKQISYKGSLSGQNGAGSTTLTINKPSLVTAGDILVAQVVVRGATTTITPPANWTLIRRDNTGSSIGVALYYGVAGASEPSTYTFTFNSSQQASGGIADYAGVDTTNPIDGNSGQYNPSTNVMTAPSITTTAANDMLLFFGAVTVNTTITPPSSMTQEWSINNGTGTGTTSEMADQKLNNSGATGTRVGTHGTATDSNIAQLVALKPQSSTQPTPTPTSASSPTNTPTPTGSAGTPQPVVSFARPGGGQWNMAFHDEFDGAGGTAVDAMSGSNFVGKTVGGGTLTGNPGLNPRKWNMGWLTGPSTLSGLGAVTTPTYWTGGGETQWWGTGSLLFPGDGALHLRSQQASWNSYNNEMGMITTAGLYALNPANSSHGNVAADRFIDGPQILEWKSSGTFIVDWPAMWMTNAGNFGNVGSQWPGGSNYNEEIDLVEPIFRMHAASEFNSGKQVVPSGWDNNSSLTWTWYFDTSRIILWVTNASGQTVQMFDLPDSQVTASMISAQWNYPQYLMFSQQSKVANPATGDMNLDYVRIWN